MNISRHANERINNRLVDVLTRYEVESAIKDIDFDIGETWVKLKVLDTTFKQYDYKSNRVISGDVIYIIVKRRDKNDNGLVATVEVRHLWQKVKGDYFIDV